MKTKHFEELVDYLIHVKSPADFKKKLEGLLTPSELNAICLRLQITRLLKEGVTQREIAKRLGVGIATVSRGSKEIQSGNL